MNNKMSQAECMIYAAAWAAAYVGNHRPGAVANKEAYIAVMQFRADLESGTNGTSLERDMLFTFAKCAK